VSVRMRLHYCPVHPLYTIRARVDGVPLWVLKLRDP
jgi:hypothetical protein